MKKQLFLFLFLFISQQCLASPEFKKISSIPGNIKSAKVITPIYSQKLAFRLPASWKKASQNQQPNLFMMEFTPQNENIGSWKNLLTIQGFENLAGRVSPERLITGTADRFKTICGKDSVFDNLGATTVGGFKAHRAILGCSKVPSQSISEVAYWLVIEGAKDIYVVQKAIRSEAGNPLTKANVDSYFSDFGPIELCKTGGERYECTK